jgi:hypothetical protein
LPAVLDLQLSTSFHRDKTTRRVRFALTFSNEQGLIFFFEIVSNEDSICSRKALWACLQIDNKLHFGVYKVP